MNKKRLSIKPYARLAAAPWVAGNIAYLRDLDFLETRLKSKTPDRPSEPSKEAEEPPARKPWKPKKKGKQSGKEGGSESPAA